MNPNPALVGRPSCVNYDNFFKEFLDDDFEGAFESDIIENIKCQNRREGCW